MSKIELIRDSLQEWVEQVELRRREIITNPDLIDQDMVICIDVGELSRSDLLDVEIFLDELDAKNVDLVVEEYYGEYPDETGAISRAHLSKEIVRDNLADVYEYREGILRIGISYFFQYYRFEGGFDYSGIAQESYEEILDNLTEISEDEYVGNGGNFDNWV